MGKVADLSVYTPGGQPGAPNPSEGLAVLRQNQTAFMETIGVMPPESLTIADGAISPTTAVCIVDTEGGAPADDLATINATLSDGSTLHDGMVILLSAKDASRVVTVKNSDAPNGVKTVDGKDIALSTEWSLVLQYVGGVWQQLNVSAPLKPATETTLGGVKVGDGLTMRDGVMSADLATDTEAGRVKASEAAKAGAVPLGGVDGSLGEDWLKKAMDAAAAAQEAADAAGGKNVKSYIVETWQSGASWYRKYSDGWIEQGGFVKSPINDYDAGDAAANVVNFYVPFKDTNYTVVTTAQYPDIEWGKSSLNAYYKSIYAWCSITNKTSKTYFTMSNICDHMWYACGF